MFDISKFQNICQCSCKKKLVRGVFRRFLSTQKYPLTALPHWRSACADLRTANSILTLTVKRAIFHGSRAKCFTSARAASCDLFPECRTNRCDADDARAREGLPLSPYRLKVEAFASGHQSIKYANSRCPESAVTPSFRDLSTHNTTTCNQNVNEML